MLAEAVVAGADKLRGTPSGRLSPSIISICPMRTYKNWKAVRVPPTGVELLRMNDGHYQEREMIDDLERAGFKIKDRQFSVHIRGLMVGHLDGKIWVNERWHLLECKAMSLVRYTAFVRKGFTAEPGIEVQVQPYLASDELVEEGITSGFVYSKHKDTCRPYDLYFEIDWGFVNPILEQVENLLKGWIPVPVRCPLCPTCNHRLGCWGAEVVDFGNVHTTSLPELVEKWKLGTNYRRYGKELIGEAREVFGKELGDKPVIFIDDLKVQRIHPTRGGISIEKFTEKFGAAAIAEVWEETKVSQMKVTEVEL